MTGNFRLQIAMEEHDVSQTELAKAVNRKLRLAGERDSVGDRTVRTWLTGKSTWPHRAKRSALEAVFGCPIEALGFYPPGAPAPPQEDPAVIRRRFLRGAGAATAAVAMPQAAAADRPSRVGTSDVIRLRDRMGELVQLDADRGGHGALERAALDSAAEAIELQKQATTQRVRQRLFALASDFRATAAWSLIDAGQLDEAGAHLDRALTLAGMAQDSDMTMQVWNLRAMLARQKRDYSEAVAAAQAAKSTSVARRCPLHASLAHARTAVGLAHDGDQSGALRSLGCAEDALGKADTKLPRADWITFYGPAELYALTAIVRDVVGHPAESEAASYRALSVLPESYRRNRANTTVRLALAQLHQGDVDEACATSGRVFSIMGGDPIPGRVRQRLGDFQRDLFARAPDTRIAHEWTDRYRTEWSTP